MTKLFVLDTNIGWDPGQILSIFILLKYITRNPDNKLCIVTNNEVNDPGDGIQQQRARIVHMLLDCFYVDFNPPVTIFSGMEEPRKIPVSRMQDICCELYDLIEKVSKGIMKWNDLLEVPPTRMMYDPLTKVPGVFDAPRVDFPNITDLNMYIEAQVQEGTQIEWIGLGSVTNIAYLVQNGLENVRIIQLAGSCNHTEENVRYNIEACRKLIDMCTKRGVSLTFVTDDVLGLPVMDNAMTWVDGQAHTITDSMRSMIHSSNHAILNLIEISLGDHQFDYTGSSVLRSPLAVMYALSHRTVLGDTIHSQERYAELGMDKHFLFPLVPAQVQCKKNGSWGIEIDFAELFSEGGVMSCQAQGEWRDAVRVTDDCLRRQWWSEQYTYFKGVASKDIPQNVQISFGCLNEEDRKDFMRVLEDLIRDNELEARIREKNAAAEAERKRLAKIQARKDAERYWSEQQVQNDISEASALVLAEYMEQERLRLEAEAAAEAERERLRVLEQMRLQREREAAEEAARKIEEERLERERLRIAKAKAKKLHMFEN